MMTDSSKWNCYIITDSGLGLKCSDILLSEKYTVKGIFTDNQKVRDWAEDNSIKHFELDINAIRDEVLNSDYDYLFSIVNPVLLTEDIINSAKIAAVNYHDSLLPESAGTNSAFWSIYNRNRYHGITWHMIDQGIDTGDIILQKRFSIRNDENTFSLNVNCYNQCLSTFNDLLKKVSIKPIRATVQDFSKRTVYGLYDRPPLAGIVEWTSRGVDILAFVAAAGYGNLDNDMVVPKLCLNGQFYIIKKAKLDNSVGKTPLLPGRIYQIEAGKLGIQTSDSKVIITKLKTIDGLDITIPEVAKLHSLKEGDLLTELSTELKSEVNELYRSTVPSEDYWVRKLSAVNLPRLPKQSNFEGISCFAPYPEIKEPYEFLVFIAALSGESKFDILLKKSISEELSNLFSGTVKLELDVDFNISFQENITKIQKQVSELCRRKTFIRDIRYRYNKLRNFSPEYPFRIFNKVIEFNKKLYRDTDIEHLHQQYLVFKSNSKESKRLLDISLVSQMDMSIYRKFNNSNDDFSSLSSIEFNKDKTYIDYFKDAVSLYPDRTALTWEEKSYSYKELDEITGRFGNFLIDQGVTEKSIVAVIAESNDNSIIGILSILKTGSAYLPVDPKYPKDRIGYMLKDSNVKTVLIAEGAEEVILPKSKEIQIIDISTSLTKLGSYSDITPDLNISPQDLVYIIYTSGTTGEPKGVMTEHHSLINHNLFAIKRYKFNKNDKVMQFGSISFDLSVEEIFPTLIIGAELILAPLKSKLILEEFHYFIRKYDITILDLPTAFWHSVVTALDTMPLPKSIKTVIIGGEKASVEKFKTWKERTAGIRLINTYGPTEGTVVATTGENLNNIGIPVSNMQCLILNKNLNLLPPDFSGELCLGGAGVARGYLNKPELTNEKFINSSFDGEIRLYRTGDLARLTSDLDLVFEGRIDKQVKVRGFRIELEEIKSAINNSGQVKQAVIHVINDSLIAYFIPSKNFISKEAIQKNITESLPIYMVPGIYVEIDDIPLTTNGKVDFSALPDPFITNEYQPPETPVQEVICNVLQQALEVDRIGLSDNFVKMGGDSITALQVISKLNNAGFSITTDILFSSDDVRQLSEKVEKRVLNGKNLKSKNIIELNTCFKGKAPIFVLHSSPGDVLGYINLVSKLDKDRPVYGIESPGLSDKSLLFGSFNTMTDYYINEIRGIQKQGPYILIGWCFGGLLAYEIARKLSMLNLRVAFLGLIDTWGRPLGVNRIYESISTIYSSLLCSPFWWKKYIRKKLFRGSSENNIFAFNPNSLRDTKGISEEIIKVRELVYMSNKKALDNYRTGPYDGEVSLFKVKEKSIDFLHDSNYGWLGIAKNLKKYEVPGSHINILKEPNVSELAYSINKLIRDI